jgi:hypothetical protein
MPQSLDIPEAVEEERWPWDAEESTPQSPMREPQRARTSVYALLQSAMKSLLTRHPQSDTVQPARPFALPREYTPQEYPILFITAMYW